MAANPNANQGATYFPKPPIRFNRQELAGSFGDLGTDFPLIVAMILAADLHAPSVLMVFGFLQVCSGYFYRMPMPVQPLKAMATLVVVQKIAGPVLLGAGLAIGLVMLVLALTGLLSWLARVVPAAVIRGIQLGLGVTLCLLASKEYIPSGGLIGYGLAALSFLLVLLFVDSKKWPAALLVVLLGVGYAGVTQVDWTTMLQGIGLQAPQWAVPTSENIATGFVLLTLPQIPLSLGNSIMATRQVATDLFPGREPLGIRKIGLTYAAMNLFVPFFGGIPCCHGAGGMVGHFAFGGRTGGSVVIYGLFYMVTGLFLGGAFGELVKVFPLPVLGTILFFEGISLMLLVRDRVSVPRDFLIALLVGALAFGLPYGFAIAMLVGTLLYYAPVPLKAFAHLGEKRDHKPGE
jgi:hypothetical protein